MTSTTRTDCVARTAVRLASTSVILLALGVSVAFAQPASSQIKPKLPPTLPKSLIAADKVLDVTIGTLQPGQTIEQNLSFNPRPVKGFMLVNGTWSMVCMGPGCEGMTNIKLRATLTSPSGRKVGEACGFAQNAGAPWQNAPTATYQPKMSAGGLWDELISPEQPGNWTLSVQACSDNPTQMAISNIKMRVAYKGGTVAAR